MNDKTYINGIMIIKHIIRGNAKDRSELRNYRYRLKNDILRLEGNKFNRSKIDKINALISGIETCIDKLAEDRNKHEVTLIKYIMAYDASNPSKHEIAQVLNISHIAFDKFLKSEHSGDGSLFTSAAMGAETFFENGDFIGSRARDNPLFRAVQSAMSRMFNENKGFADLASRKLDEMLGGLTKYKQVVQPDGTLEMARVPPELKVV